MYDTDIKAFKIRDEDICKIENYKKLITELSNMCCDIYTKYYYQNDGDINVDIFRKMIDGALKTRYSGKLTNGITYNVNQFISECCRLKSIEEVNMLESAKKYLDRLRWEEKDVKNLLDDSVELCTGIGDETLILQFDNIPGDITSVIILSITSSYALLEYV